MDVGLDGLGQMHCTLLALALGNAVTLHLRADNEEGRRSAALLFLQALSLGA
jgi:hypothetical protein